MNQAQLEYSRMRAAAHRKTADEGELVMLAGIALFAVSIVFLPLNPLDFIGGWVIGTGGARAFEFRRLARAEDRRRRAYIERCVAKMHRR